MNFNKDIFIQRFIIIVYLVFLSLFIMFPISIMLKYSLEDNNGIFVGLANFIEYLSSKNLSSSLLNSIIVSTLTTIITVPLALIYSYAVSRVNIPLKRFFSYAAVIPLFATTMMYGLSLIYLFGNKGIINMYILKYFNISLEIYGLNGIVLSEVFYTFPHAFLILSVAFSMSDYRLYEAAESLGASRIKIFFSVTLPSIRYGLFNAMVVVFVMSFTDIGAPKIIGGMYNVIAVDIYKNVVGQHNMSMGAVVGFFLLIPGILAFIVEQYLKKKQLSSVNSKSVPYRIKSNNLLESFMFIYCFFIFMVIFVFISIDIYASFVSYWPYNMKLTLNNYTFKYVSGGLDTIYNSVKISVLSSIFGVIVIFINGYINEKISTFSIVRKVNNFMAIIPLAIPGLVLGFSYILFFNKTSFNIFGLNINNIFNFLYGTTAIMIIANIVHFYSVPYLTSVTALKKLDKEFELMAECFSVPLRKVFMKVSVPMSFKAIVDISFYLFVNSMVTVSALVFLYSPENKPATVAIINMEEAGDIGPATALSVIVLLINLAVKLGYELFSYYTAKGSYKP